MHKDMHKKNVTLSLATELVIQCTLFPTLGGMILNKTVSRYTKDFSTMHDHCQLCQLSVCFVLQWLGMKQELNVSRCIQMHNVHLC